MKQLFSLPLLLLVFQIEGKTQNWYPATGNVGIGTTSPAFNLDITTSAITTLQIGTTSGTGNPNLIFKGSLGQWKIAKSISAGGSSAPSQLDFSYNTGVYGGDRGMMSYFIMVLALFKETI